MSEEQILLGSLSQDLFRIANFIASGSVKAAERFWVESRKWLLALEKYEQPDYLAKILQRLRQMEFEVESREQAELILTYGVIIQSLVCHKKTPV